MVLVTIYS